MKNIFKILSIFLGLALLFTACTPKEYELGSLMDKSNLKFSITQSASDSNMVILKSLTPGVTPQWVTPLGNSVRVQDTVKVAFPGVYKFVYGVESAGGLVQADTVTLNIRTTNLSYVNDPLWTMICGGVGNEKTWLLDITAAGVSKNSTSPKYFCGADENWDTWHDRINGVKDDAIKAKYGLSDIWLWGPTWSETGWMQSAMPAADYGTMTFDLKGGAAHATITHLTIPAFGTQHGTFLLDAVKHTLKLNNAAILHPSASEGDAKNGWSDVKVLFLSNDYMQINVPGVACFNFISKDFSDNWVPKVVKYNEPIKDSFTKADLVGTWRYGLVAQNWISWEVAGSGKGGSLENSWKTRTDMVTTLSSWGNANVATTFANADASLYVFNADGTCTLNGVANTYTVSNGVIAFGTPLTGTEWSLISISLTGNSVNVLNVTTIGSDAYTSSGIWIGIRNGSKNEDQAVQLIKQ